MNKGKSFEDLISWIHTCLAEKARIMPDAKIPDKDSGELRQVDIAIYVTDGPYQMFIIVEVRDRKKPVGSGYVDEIKGKRDSMDADAAVIVSKSGFTKPAIQKAEKQNIRIMTYDEALKDSWVQWAMMRTITVVNRTFEILRVDFTFDHELDDVSTKSFSSMLNVKFKPEQVKFQVEGETKQFDINSLVKQALDQNPSVWEGVMHNAPAVKKAVRIYPNNQPPIMLVAGTSLIPIRQVRVVLNLKIVAEERPLTYNTLRSITNGSSVSDVISAIIPFGSGRARLEIMTKGGSKVIEADQKVFLRAVPLP
jgi:hypothetical protein